MTPIMSDQDVNDLLAFFAESLKTILGDQLLGLYLTGSLTYGDLTVEAMISIFLPYSTRFCPARTSTGSNGCMPTLPAVIRCGQSGSRVHMSPRRCWAACTPQGHRGRTSTKGGFGIRILYMAMSGSSTFMRSTNAEFPWSVLIQKSLSVQLISVMSERPQKEICLRSGNRSYGISSFLRTATTKRTPF